MKESERFYDLALSLLIQGQHERSIELLRQVLSEDPDNAEAHAVLSVCLYEGHRLHAARYEAQTALGLDADLPLAHYAMAYVMIGLRNLNKAEDHLKILLDLEPHDARNYLLKAYLCRVRGRKKEISSVLRHALELEPENMEVKVELGENFLEQGEIGKAEEIAKEVLKEYPEHQEGLTLMGWVYLRRGQIREAREHAIWALRQDPSDHDTLQLLSAVKARESFLLGWWWRYHTKLSELGHHKAILLVLAVFVFYRAAVIYAHQNGQDFIAGIVQWIWIGICLYTWIGPNIFEKSVKKELEKVELKEDF